MSPSPSHDEPRAWHVIVVIAARNFEKGIALEDESLKRIEHAREVLNARRH